MKTAIITFDMINAICSEGGALSGTLPQRIQQNNVINYINKINEHGRKNNFLIIHVKLAFNSSYTDCSQVSPIFPKQKKIKFYN